MIMRPAWERGAHAGRAAQGAVASRRDAAWATCALSNGGAFQDRKLQAVHALTHPTAKLERRPAAEADNAGSALVKTTVSVDELFALLAPEGDDAESDDATALSEC